MEGKDDFLKKLGKQIQKLRKQKGISLREFELRGDLSRHFLSEVENGKRCINVYNLKRITDALEVEFEELFKDFKK